MNKLTQGDALHIAVALIDHVSKPDYVEVLERENAELRAIIIDMAGLIAYLQQG
jgi:hypothetical protein